MSKTHQSRTRKPLHTVIAFLLRHRWIGDLEKKRWVCHRLAVRLDTTAVEDPTCPGCRSTIDYDDLSDRKDYPDAEAIQLALDLLFARLTVAQARAEVARLREAS